MKYRAYLDGKSVADNLDTPRYKHTGLEPNTEYSVQFSAYDGDKESPLSEALVVKTPPMVPTGVTMTPATLSLEVGAKSTPAVKVSPAKATDKTVRYVSSKPAVASVSASGEITALAEGIADITVTTNSGAKKAKTVVTVTADEAEEPVEPPIEELEE